jgi:predicted RNase H-like nuclease (RuvC/YqgF family)
MDVVLQILGYLLTPITGVVGWLAGKRARNNDMLNRMQETIDMVVDKNSKLIEQMTELREENSQLKLHLMVVRKENAELKDGQEELKRQLVAFEKRFNIRKCNSEKK